MLFYYIIIILIFLFIYYNFLRKEKETFNNKYKLGLLAIIKNEEMIINEWIEHYLWQGVDHFYIIDNGSTDATKNKLQPYIDKGIISYFYLDEKYKQEEYYNYILNLYIKNNCDWLIICDADEYFYNRKKGKNIKTYVNKLNIKDVNSITLNWKMFGSNGYDKQPSNIRKSFLYKWKVLHENVKTIINVDLTNKIIIHDHQFTSGEKILNPEELALNHYPIMSKEYFSKVKMTRGAADTIHHENVRNWDYFNKYDRNEVFDNELAKLLE